MIGYYFSFNGNDTNCGTLTAPYRTLERALTSQRTTKEPSNIFYVDDKNIYLVTLDVINTRCDCCPFHVEFRT